MKKSRGMPNAGDSSLQNKDRPIGMTVQQQQECKLQSEARGAG